MLYIVGITSKSCNDRSSACLAKSLLAVIVVTKEAFINSLIFIY